MRDYAHLSSGCVEGVPTWFADRDIV